METPEFDYKVLNIHYESPMPAEAPDFIDLIESLENGQKIMLSITPAQLDGNAADVNFGERDKKILRWAYETGKVDIAQQGYNHRCSFPKCNKMHEFGYSFDEGLERIQLEKIQRGKKIITEFFGIEPVIFSPPDHIYTKKTIDILFKEGFRYITDASIILGKPYEYDVGMTVLPESRRDFGKAKTGCSNLFYMHNDKIDFEFFVKNRSDFVRLYRFIEKTENRYSGNILDRVLYNSNLILKNTYKAIK